MIGLPFDVDLLGSVRASVFSVLLACRYCLLFVLTSCVPIWVVFLGRVWFSGVFLLVLCWWACTCTFRCRRCVVNVGLVVCGVRALAARCRDQVFCAFVLLLCVRLRFGRFRVLSFSERRWGLLVRFGLLLCVRFFVERSSFVYLGSP